MGFRKQIVVVIIAFHEAAQAVLQLNGEISPVKILLYRGLKQGSVLPPILFNIFFGVLTREFEKRCVERTTIDTILGVKVKYNLDGGFMDDTQKLRQKNLGIIRTVTIVEVLYADNCVMFTNTIAAMQIMIVVFDDVAKLFGTELAIHKTKIVCNGEGDAGKSRNCSSRDTDA